MSQTAYRLLLGFSAAVAFGAVSCASTPDPRGVQVRQLADRIRIEIDGELLTEYHYQRGSRPFLYPLLAPGGIPLTRAWPIETGTEEEQDHPHHRSFWFAHGDVNGHDFWSESEQAGRTIHEKFLELRSGRDTGLIRSANRLVAKDGTPVATDERTFRFHRRPGVRLLDFEVTIHASHGELRFGDTKEGTFALRLAETMRLAPNRYNKGKPTGHILNSEGGRDGDTWGKRARWVDYSGPVRGATYGVTIFDHPSNPRHPTWWHVRDYGLFAANPFGIHDFEKKPPGTGNLVVPAGQSVTFRYRILLHPGDADAAQIAKEYDAYCRQTAKP